MESQTQNPEFRNNCADFHTCTGLEKHSYVLSDSFTILGLWVLGLAVSNINESNCKFMSPKTLSLMTSLQYYCIPGLAGTR